MSTNNFSNNANDFFERHKFGCGVAVGAGIGVPVTYGITKASMESNYQKTYAEMKSQHKVNLENELAACVETIRKGEHYDVKERLKKYQ